MVETDVNGSSYVGTTWMTNAGNLVFIVDTPIDLHDHCLSATVVFDASCRRTVPYVFGFYCAECKRPNGEPGYDLTYNFVPFDVIKLGQLYDQFTRLKEEVLDRWSRE